MELGTEKIDQEYEDFKETVDNINMAADEKDCCARKSTEKADVCPIPEPEDASDRKKYADEETKEREISEYNEQEVERVRQMEMEQAVSVEGNIAAGAARTKDQSSSTDGSEPEDKDGFVSITIVEETVVEIQDDDNDTNP